MKTKRIFYKLNPFIIIFFSIFLFSSSACAELTIESATPTLGLLGQDLDVSLAGIGVAANTRVSMYPDTGNKRGQPE